MKSTERFVAVLLIAVDAAMLLLGAVLAYYSRFHPYFVTLKPIVFDLSMVTYLHSILPLLALWIVVFAFSGLYSTERVGFAKELTKVAGACSTSMAFVFALLFFSRFFFESRFIAVVGWITAIVCVAAGRLTVRFLQRQLRRFHIGLRPVAVVGSSSTSETLLQTFAEKTSGIRVIKRFEAWNERTKKELQHLRDKQLIEEVVLADPNTARDTVAEILLFTESQHLGFLFAADLTESAIGRSVVHTFGGIPLIEVQKTPLDGWGAIYKRLFDIAGSLFLIIVSAPLMCVIALLIAIDSKGPILYRHLDNGEPTKRIGRHGKPFFYFKFRSMRPQSHFERYTILSKKNTRKGPVVKIKDDPRITRVGRWIRTLSLDELPEFFLVLRGHMSLVGPRPHLPEEVSQYAASERKVLTIKPGITGMAQVSGRETLDFSDEVRLDVYYIEHWSPWLDCILLLKTPFIVLFRRQAS